MKKMATAAAAVVLTSIPAFAIFGLGDIVFHLPVEGVLGDHGFQVGTLPGQLAELVHVARRILGGEHGINALQAVGETL